MTYQYYLNPEVGYQQYFGRFYEIILPIYIYFINFLYQDFSVDIFSFIINSSIILLIYFSISRHLQNLNLGKFQLPLLLYFTIFEYGTTLQLMRQSLGISLFLFGASYSGLIRIFLYTTALLTHIGSILPIFLCTLFSIGNNNFRTSNRIYLFFFIIVGLLPLISYQIGDPHESLTNGIYIKTLDFRDYIYLASTIFLFSININSKVIKNILLLIFGYYLYLMLYNFFGFTPLFERFFLLYRILVLPISFVISLCIINYYIRGMNILLILLINYFVLLKILLI